MEHDNESSGLNSSYYHHHHPQHPLPPPPPPQTTPTPTPTTLPINPTLPSPSNGITISTPNINNNNYNSVPSSGAPQMVYSHSLTSAVSTPLETVKRKRGRPRKYGTPELAAAAKRFGASGSPPVSSTRKGHGQGFSASAGVSSVSSRKSQFESLGNAGQGFTPHVISVNPGEDVGQKISVFMQQSNREMCILSASGTVSSASLRQPATSGGSVTYEGQFEILTLKGSYVRSEFGGRTGGISVCLVSEGQIFGGGLGGPLIAAGPVQVILGSFVIDTKKDMAGSVKVDGPASNMASPVGGASVSGVSFRSPVDSPRENIGGGQFVLQPQAMHMTQSQSMEWRGSSSHGMQQSPENGDYTHMPE